MRLAVVCRATEITRLHRSVHVHLRAHLVAHHLRSQLALAIPPKPPAIEARKTHYDQLSNLSDCLIFFEHWQLNNRYPPFCKSFIANLTQNEHM